MNDCLDFLVKDVGYIVPQHGLKGRMQELMDSEDLIEMLVTDVGDHQPLHHIGHRCR